MVELERWIQFRKPVLHQAQRIKHKDGDGFLRPRPVGGGFSNTVIEYFNVDKDPMIRIYAYMDDACRGKGSMSMNAEECVKALDSIMYEYKFFGLTE